MLADYTLSPAAQVFRTQILLLLKTMCAQIPVNFGYTQDKYMYN